MSNLIVRAFRVCFPCFVLLSTVIGTAVAADQEEKLPPYDVNGLPNGKIWIPWVAAFLFAAGILFLAFKNPHRSNLERQ